MELIERLANCELFHRLDAEDLARVAALAHEHNLPAGAILCRQADIGTTYFVLDSGEAIIQRVDDKGYARPIGSLREGDAFGTTSLFLSEPRDATVVTRTPMHLWTIERSELEALQEQHPGIARALTVPDDISERRAMPQFDWLANSETVVLYSHRHWLHLAVSIFIATIVAAAVLGGAMAFLSRYGGDWDATGWLFIPAALYLAFVCWHWFDWLNDQLVVTTQRISFREQIAMFYEARNEVPIDRVQNINVISTFWGRALHYGTIVIETAAQTGTLKLTRIPDPEYVRDVIWDQTERTQATRHAAERRLMTDALASRLGVDTEESMPDVGLPGEAADGSGAADADAVAEGGPLRRMARWVGTRWAAGEPYRADQTVWRKHPVFLVQAGLVPLFATLLAVGLAGLSWFGWPAMLAQQFAVYPLVVTALAAAAGFWLTWSIIDWANDQYIITADRIVDVEQRPFSLRSERREASLSVIQNVRFVIPNFWAAMWGYGNVLVQTAGTGDFTFDRVGHPADVQAEIMRRIEDFRERARQQEAAQRRQEMAEWFAIYRDLGGDGQASPVPPPDAAP